MPNPQDFTITEVQERNKWSGAHGEFQDYALKLVGVDGWVALTQKPETAAPTAGSTLHGYTEVQTRGDKTYLKFKKVNPDYNGPNQGQSTSSATSMVGNDQTLDYIVEMLEELTGRRQKADVAPTDIPDDENFDLSEIPF